MEIEFGGEGKEGGRWRARRRHMQQNPDTNAIIASGRLSANARRSEEGMR
jgi:hypothetical protein